jgi:hypothetical protein
LSKHLKTGSFNTQTTSYNKVPGLRLYDSTVWHIAKLQLVWYIAKLQLVWHIAKLQLVWHIAKLQLVWHIAKLQLVWHIAKLQLVSVNSHSDQIGEQEV